MFLIQSSMFLFTPLFSSAVLLKLIFSPEAKVAHVAVVFFLSLTVNFLCHRLPPCLQSSFGIVCGKMCQVKFLPLFYFARGFNPVPGVQ